LIDFNLGTPLLNAYAGSERKAAIEIDGRVFMIKFPDPVRDKRRNLSYKNNQFSEFIGCHIFSIIGMEVQNTELGFYTNGKGVKKLVVGCEDFTQDGSRLIEFERFGDGFIESDYRFDTSVESVYEIIKNSPFIENKEEAINFFWDMFVVDALIGNSDRHMENWGFLQKGNRIRLAPVYDCGSALSPLIEEDEMEYILTNDTDFKNREYNARSVYKMNGKTVFYHELFKRPTADLKEAIMRVFPKIDLSAIALLINSVDEMSGIRKEYMKKAIELRYQSILKPAYIHAKKECD